MLNELVYRGISCQLLYSDEQTALNEGGFRIHLATPQIRNGSCAKAETRIATNIIVDND